jgi:hypothetical protein
MLTTIARFFLLAGLVFLLIGGGLYLLGRLNLPVGRLPGDFRIQRGNFTLHIPLATSILLSIALTLVLNILLRWLGRR